MWASLSVFNPADGHSLCTRVKSCLWALWSAFACLWFALVLDLLAISWGAIVEDVDDNIAIIVMIKFAVSTSDMVNLDSIWKKVGCVLLKWSFFDRFWSVYRLRSSLDNNWCCSSVMVSGFRFFRFGFVNCFRFNSFLRFWFSLNNNSVVDVWVLTLVEDFSGCNLFGSWSCLYNFFN